MNPDFLFRKLAEDPGVVPPPPEAPKWTRPVNQVTGFNVARGADRYDAFAGLAGGGLAALLAYLFTGNGRAAAGVGMIGAILSIIAKRQGWDQGQTKALLDTFTAKIGGAVKDYRNSAYQKQLAQYKEQRRAADADAALAETKAAGTAAKAGPPVQVKLSDEDTRRAQELSDAAIARYGANKFTGEPMPRYSNQAFRARQRQVVDAETAKPDLAKSYSPNEFDEPEFAGLDVTPPVVDVSPPTAFTPASAVQVDQSAQTIRPGTYAKIDKAWNAQPKNPLQLQYDSKEWQDSVRNNLSNMSRAKFDEINKNPYVPKAFKDEIRVPFEMTNHMKQFSTY